LIPGIALQIVQWFHPGVCAIRFPQYVVANRTHKGAEALRLADTALGPYGCPCPQERFLLHVFYMLRASQATAQLVIQYLAEIRDKMGFSGDVLGPELMQISFIELMENHALRGSHFPNSLQRTLRSISAATANGFPCKRWVSPPIACRTHHKMNVNRCLFHKTQVVWISLQGFGLCF
jgi:hypothetical protein